MKIDREPKPPFRVDFVDQFQGHCEDGYGTLATFQRQEDAISEAQRIMDEGIAAAGSFHNWYGMGEAGLVCDSIGILVWDGIEEGRKQAGKADQEIE